MLLGGMDRGQRSYATKGGWTGVRGHVLLGVDGQGSEVMHY